MHPDEIGAKLAELAQAFQWSALVLLQALLDFLPCFMDVAMHGQIQLLGKCQDPVEGTVGDGVGGMRGQAEADQRVIRPGFADGQAFVEVVICITG